LRNAGVRLQQVQPLGELLQADKAAGLAARMAHVGLVWVEGSRSLNNRTIKNNRQHKKH
jgi:hypothetical protein